MVCAGVSGNRTVNDLAAVATDVLMQNVLCLRGFDDHRALCRSPPVACLCPLRGNAPTSSRCSSRSTRPTSTCAGRGPFTRCAPTWRWARSWRYEPPLRVVKFSPRSGFGCLQLPRLFIRLINDRAAHTKAAGFGEMVWKIRCGTAVVRARGCHRV